MMRLFAAIDLPERIAEQLAQVQAELQSKLPERAVRWVRPQNIHLTLKFIGEVPAKTAQGYAQAVEAAANEVSAFLVEVSDFGCFPNPQRPRVLWVGVKEPTGQLDQLQAKLEDHMSKLGIDRERRPYKPHLTIGRVKQSSRELADLLRSYRPGSLGSFEAAELCLFRSELKSTGAVYTRLVQAEFPL